MDLNLLQNNIGDLLNEFKESQLKPRKFLYLNSSFFEKDLEMEFKYFFLSDEDINKLNESSKGYFKNNDIKIKFVVSGNRIDINITNIAKLFTGSLSTASKVKYPYIKEFIFYNLLKNINISEQILNIQKNNTLVTYIYYLLKSENFELTRNIEFTHVSNTPLKEKFLNKKDFKDLYINKLWTGKIDFITELKDLLELTSQTDSQEKNYFFRGQADSNWGISASISREISFLNYEHNMYYDILSLRPREFTKDNSIYKQLITMQHYGFPTRLIDVTRNPLIALYFACENSSNIENFNKDGAFFILSEEDNNILNFESKELNCLSKIVPNKFDEICKGCTEKNCDKSSLHRSYVIKGIAGNERINNQSGDFIFVGIDPNKKYLEKLTQEIEKIIIIDKNFKNNIINELKLLNIHGGTVYPDLANMSEYLKEEYKSKKISQSVDLSKIKSDSRKLSIDNLPSISSIFESLNQNLDLDSSIIKKIKILLEENVEYHEKNEDTLKVISDLLKANHVGLTNRRCIKNIVKKSLKLNMFFKEIINFHSTIVIAENSFAWKEYFEDPNSIEVPIYNINEWAISKTEIIAINEVGLRGIFKEFNSFVEKIIPHNKLIEFVSDFGNGDLIAMYDFKKESLFL